MTSTQTGTTWDINDNPTLSATISDGNALATQPATVKLRVVDPANTVYNLSWTSGGANTTTNATVLPALANPATGSFQTTCYVQTAGLWQFRWETTSPAIAEEGSFLVKSASVSKIN